VTGLPGEETRGLAQDLALLTQLPDLTTQPGQLITLGDGEAVGAPAGVEVGVLDPLTDRGLGQPSSLATWPAVLPVVPIGPTTSALHSGGKNRRGVASDSHLEGRPSSWVSTQPGQLQSLLAAAGIPCVLAPNEAAGAYAIDRSGGARILVADADAHHATTILTDHPPNDEDEE
jgi:hypothetical protein